MAFRNSTRLGFINNNLSTLTRATNKFLLKYNHSLGRFDLVSPDDLITSATTQDNNTALPETFIDQIEEQIEFDNIQNRNYDGGAF